MKIAVFSSADNSVSLENKRFVISIAKYLRKYDVTLVTGGSVGVPGLLVEEYKKLEGTTMMFSPDTSHEQHNKRFDNHDIMHYDNVVYGSGFTQRSLDMIHFVDGAIALGGRTGTLCECLMAIEESLPLVIIDSMGGVSERFRKIINFTNKEPFGFLDIGSSYSNQIDKLINQIKNHAS